MRAACAQCGTPHNLNEAQIGGHTRVQFRCACCGHTNVVAVQPGSPAVPLGPPEDPAQRPNSTQVISPLPSFARSEGTGGLGDAIASQYQGLALPRDKTLALRIVGGPASGLEYSISKPRVVLGRAEADVLIDDPGVSRWHCALEIKDNAVRLRDLDSTNGTYVNEERVRAAELTHLSEFRIGSTVVRLTILPR